MSMLAEPRRKKAWILNPRKSQWAEDESKYGQKMLEQMGWSKGKGLGKEMAGITEHIRPPVQNDSRGLGYEGRADDWVAHLDDFNDLLANLQQGQRDISKEGTTNSDVKSLEERSKKSKARVHYHKFTRGKDLSRYSSQDLASILGGRAEGGAASQPVTPVSSRPPSPPPHADSEPASETETEPPRAPTAERDTSSGYTTINTGLSVKDYFAAKMRKMKMLKIKLEQEQDTTSAGEKHWAEATEDTALEPSGATENRGQEERKSKKKSKKQRSASFVEEAALASAPEKENIVTEEPKKKKKKMAVPSIEEALPSVPEERNISSEERKNTKRKRLLPSPVEKVLPSVFVDENITSDESKKKKRKKRKDAESRLEEAANVNESPEMSPADARSTEDNTLAADASEQAPDETTEMPSKKKKKQKKNKSKLSGDSN